MSGKKKNGNQNDALTKRLILVTALIQLIKSLCDLIAKLLD